MYECMLSILNNVRMLFNGFSFQIFNSDVHMDVECYEIVVRCKFLSVYVCMHIEYTE